MGIEIVKASVVHGKRLSGNAYKVLIAMSLTALDRPKDGHPASLYYGGWAALGMVLGYPEKAANDRNTAAHKAVKRAVRELREAQHVTPMVTAFKGSRQSYFVHPGGLGKGGQIDPVKGDQNDPSKGDQNGPQRGTKVTPPRKDLGQTENLSNDISLVSETELQTAREDERPGVVGHRFEGRSRDEACTVCGKSYIYRPAHPLHLIHRGA